jgi:hypothetical protein
MRNAVYLRISQGPATFEDAQKGISRLAEALAAEKCLHGAFDCRVAAYPKFAV